MIQARTVYQLKFGKIDQAVGLFKRVPKFVALPDGVKVHHHLLTDISGPMYTLVEEIMLPDFEHWETGREAIFRHPEFAEWYQGFQRVVESGDHEFFTVEGDYSEWSRPGALVVRQVFRAHQWQVHAAVNLLQRYGALQAQAGAGRNPRILTDISGPLFQVVIEIETDGLSEWEAHRREMFQQPEFQVWFLQLVNQVDQGRHEFYRVEV
jgi:hypothetical protein